MVTYMVGGLSAINAVAGAYSDDLPLLLISGGIFHFLNLLRERWHLKPLLMGIMNLMNTTGGPNTNDGHDRHLIHHTIGEIELYQSAKCFEPVVAKTFVIRHIKVFHD